ncbi:hypothetical protein AB0910_24735 [Streptomyces sp. NPDC047002]|uniref:hypothetical protein n=1 Tax=Streptomyces sp. NPDC047002 TaxID=3155475 RepID=UPI0034530B04
MTREAFPARPGTWHVALGPCTVAPEGLPYEVTITLAHGPQAPTPRRRGCGPRADPRGSRGTAG